MRALCFGVLVVAGTACFIPPGDNFFFNSAPLIVEATPEGAHVVVTEVSACKTIEFVAQVQDVDLDDRLRYQWYVDETTVREDYLINVERTSLRRTLASWTVIPKAPRSPMKASGTYVVELLVADNDIIRRKPAPLSLLPDGGAVPAGSDRWRWTVSVPVLPDCPEP